MDRHPELSLDNQLCFSLYRASRAVTRAYQPLLKDLGLTYPQYITMLALWEHDRPRGMHELVRELGLDSGTLTPVCRRLEQAGLITRQRDTADERRLIITLTGEGRALQQQALGIPAQLSCLYQGEGIDPAALKKNLDNLATLLDGN